MPVRLLLVDDNPAFLEAAASFLSADPDIKIAGLALSGRDALEQVARLHPDLVLLDLAMPEMNGLEATRRIKAQPGAPRVVILTLHDNPEYQAAAQAVGADGFVAKSEFGAQLLSLIHGLFAGPPARAPGGDCPQRSPSGDKSPASQSLEDATLQSLRESEARYRSLFDRVLVGLYRSTAEGRILDANPALVEMLGYPDRESLLTVNAADLYLHAEDRQREQALLVQEGIVRDFETQWRRRDGAVIWVRDTARAVRDADGRMRCYEGSLEDITERKQNEAALQRQNARLQALYHVGQAVNSTLEIDAILDHLVDEAVRLTRATHGQVLVVREDLGLFERRSLRGFSPEEAELAHSVSLPLDRGLNGQAYATRQAVYVDDVRTIPGYFPLIAATRAEVAVPIVREGQVLGNLDLQSPEIDAFHDVDLDYLGALADQVAIALEKARLYDEARRRNRELALLNRVIAASTASQDVASILETVCRELAQALSLPNASAALLNEAKTEAVVVAEYRPQDRPSLLGVTIPLPEDLRAVYLENTTPLVVVDAQTDALLAPIRDLFRRRGTVSLLLLPLFVEGEVVGSLGVDATGPRPFSAEEVDLARRVAEQVAGALAHTRLEETHRRLTTAVEQAAESIAITNPEGVMLYVNPAFERITGYSGTEAIGQNRRLLKSGKHDAAFYGNLWRTISAGQVWQGRFVNRKKDGSLYTEDAVITPVRNQGGEIVSYVATMRDVTREVELEEQFRQAQKMEAVGRLAGGVAHDFNNLLTVIHLSTRLMERNLHPEDSLWPHVERIQEAGRRAANLTKQLLAFSRREIAEPQVLDLNQVLGDLDKMLQRLIPEDIEVTTRLTDDLWPVRIDPTQIEQVVVNLAVNAGDAMPGGGKLTIETANVTLDAAYAAHHLEVEPGEYVLLAVSDNGVGMTAEIKARIFEPFFTTKEKGKGTGLGLATVFGIVKQNQGHVWVYSEPDQGTTFKIYLPRAGMPRAGMPRAGIPHVSEDARTPSHLPTRGAAPTARGSETLLLVEDESGVRELVRDILAAQGYRVLAAQDGVEALQVAGKHEGPIHLLVTDVVMPRLSGRALADQLRSGRPEMRVLFTSGYTDNAIVRHGVLEEGVHFLSKPFELETLARKVQEVLDAAERPSAEVEKEETPCDQGEYRGAA